MNNPYTLEEEFLSNVTVGFKYSLPPNANSPSIGEVKPDPNRNFVVNFAVSYVFQNIIPLANFSIGDVLQGESILNEYMKIQQAKMFFERNKSEFVTKYSGMFVAILGNSIIDYDKDFSLLADRVYKKYGYQTIFMPFVQSQQATLRILSPRTR